MEARQSSTGGSPVESENAVRQGGWLFPLMLLVVLLVALGMVVLNRSFESAGDNSVARSAWTPSDEPTGETVQLEIDFGNGAKRQIAALPWEPEMTVVDVLESAREFRPAVEFTQQGEGAGGFLTSLEGLANEGGGRRNWRFFVNDRPGETSFCVAEVAAGDRVLWEFTGEY